MPVSQEIFKQGMQQLAATVTVITAHHNGVRSGLTATAVSSVTNDPPSLLVCVNKSAGTHDLIVDSGKFSVNLLNKDHVHISNGFATPVANPEEKFTHGEWQESTLGTPVLTEALTAFSCAVSEVVHTNTHTIFIGTIEEIQQNEQLPLIYGNKGYKTLTDI